MSLGDNCSVYAGFRETSPFSGADLFAALDRYIQHWQRVDSISDKSAQRILQAAAWILKAGVQSIGEGG